MVLCSWPAGRIFDSEKHARVAERLQGGVTVRGEPLLAVVVLRDPLCLFEHSFALILPSEPVKARGGTDCRVAVV